MIKLNSRNVMELMQAMGISRGANKAMTTIGQMFITGDRGLAEASADEVYVVEDELGTTTLKYKFHLEIETVPRKEGPDDQDRTVREDAVG